MNPFYVEFSARTRRENLERMRSEEFDVLVVGGGVTGAAVARDAAQRGLSVALVEKADFASGTSSRSSKLIHGGLRYLENLEFGLVFEALSERALLGKTAPHLVRPLPFYFPIYRGDPHGMRELSLGLWLYDLLSLFRSPGMHRVFFKKGFLKRIPFLRHEGLRGGFRYFDASMRDDLMVFEILRSAQACGAVAANYCEAVSPRWVGSSIQGFRVRDGVGGAEFDLRAKKVILCAGPWTDILGRKLSPDWKKRLAPSTGVHLVFPLSKIPVPGAVVLSHPSDGRIVFVIPRPELGEGVAIVGTTDGPAPEKPEDARVQESEERYLLDLLDRYFPQLALSEKDVLSTYIGIRPLLEPLSGGHASLQKLSREHDIEMGPGGIVWIAGGKYTTHRVMAEQTVDFLLKHWDASAELGKPLKKPKTRSPINPLATREATKHARKNSAPIPEAIWDRYGAEALGFPALLRETDTLRDAPGFPWLEAQLRFAVRNTMLLKVEDFLARRTALALTRRDGGEAFRKRLEEVLQEELAAL